MAEVTDGELLAALYAGGVENWTWFGDSLAGLSDEDMKDDTAVMDALRSGGVDDWDGYGFAVEDLYPEEDEDDEEPVEQEVPVEVAQPMLESERRLRAHLGDSYDEQKKAFWWRSSNPRLINRLMKQILRPDGGTIEDVRLAYLDEVLGKG